MALPLESVPNFSEGRDQATIDALAESLGGEATSGRPFRCRPQPLGLHARRRGRRAGRGAARRDRMRARAHRPSPPRGRAPADRRGRRRPARPDRAGGHAACAGAPPRSWPPRRRGARPPGLPLRRACAGRGPAFFRAAARTSSSAGSRRRADARLRADAA